MTAEGKGSIWLLSTIGGDVWAGLVQTWKLLWGLTLGFLLSAVVQTLVPEAAIRRYARDDVRGVAATTLFGIVSSSCNYANAAITRSLYRKGAGPRSALAFMISATTMNIAVLALAWSFLGWRGAMGLFVGGAVIIAVVMIGFALVFRPGELERLRASAPGRTGPESGAAVSEDAVCGMSVDPDRAAASATYAGRDYHFCAPGCRDTFLTDPTAYLGTATPRS